MAKDSVEPDQKSKSPQKRSLYMFTIVPPEPLAGELRELQHLMARDYHSHEALRRPVHLTLIPPFEATIVTEPTLIHFVRKFAPTQPSFTLQVQGFGQFRERVIFAAPTQSEPLARLHHTLAMEFSSRFQDVKLRSPHDKFHPHFTLAYRDLTHSMFFEAWAKFRVMPLDRTFMVDHICLMRHDDQWVEIARGQLGA